jgi:hypothetical protein
MNNVKTIDNNMLQINLFFNKFGINPHSAKNIQKLKTYYTLELFQPIFITNYCL